MRRKGLFLIGFILMTAHVVSGEPLKVDLSQNGDVQAGWIDWNTGGDRLGNSDVSRPFANEADFDNDFTIEFINIDSRNRGQVDDSIPLHDLLDDGFKESAAFDMVIKDLAAGKYVITTYHHDTNEDVVNDDGTINVTVNDAEGTRVVADHLQQSWGPNPTFVASTTFTFFSDGSEVVITFEDNNDGIHNEAHLNGFELDIEGVIVNAHGPIPANDSLYADTWASLSWSPGGTAASHDVYFGENFDDVNDGTAETFQGNQTLPYFVVGFPGYLHPDGLVPGTTYYWRIDEVEADGTTIYKGYVWSFTIPINKAYDPEPPDGAKFIDPNVNLSWTSGFSSKLHNVYFGENFDDVNSAVVGLPQATSTYAPGTLEFDTSYYWRIDEFDGVATYKGDIWRFKTLPEIQIKDPNLMGWWMFDEGYGTTALDWSGYGNHGTLNGDPQWVAGYDGDALDFDGMGDYVYAPEIQLPANAFTMALWFNSSSALDMTGPRKDLLYWDAGSRPHLTFNRSGNGEICLWPSINGDIEGPHTRTDSWNAGTWYHIAGSFDGASFKIFVNGEYEKMVNHPGTHDDASGLFIGCRSNFSNNFSGKIDDVRIYDKALTQEEIKLAMRGDTTLAWDPNPGNRSTSNIKDATPLSFSPGDDASQHDVYFGTDKDAVSDADASDTTGVYRGRQGATSYTPSEGVEWGGGPYYWRIDEFNTDGTINKGRIWNFTVTDYLTVDDFEDYDTGENQIWYAWKDGLGYGTPGAEPYYAGNGTGSAVGDETTGSYTEETIVHGGGQAMPLSYDNNQQDKLKYSEVEMTLSYPRDWTEEGVGVLSIWFRGDSDNAAEPMYVALNNSAIVNHDNPDAAQIDEWTLWNIDLQAFADQSVNLANVNTIAIGLGNRNNLVAGGSGKMYFDDIRLYRLLP